MVIRIFLLFTLLVSVISAQDFSANARTDSARFLIGDFITYKINLKYPSAYRYKLWEVQKGLGGLELISAAQPKVSEENGVNKVELAYTFAGYDSGYKTISGGEVLFIKNTMSDTQKVSVDSVVVFINVVSVDTASEIKDINSPRRIPMSTEEILMLVGIGLVVILVGFLIYRYLRRREVKEVKPEEPIIPVDVRVLSRLDELENKRLWQNGLIREYHTEITEIIRGYFEEKLAIAALEMTTGEIYNALSRGLKDQRVASITEQFLNNADLVKFAKFVPLAGINEEMMSQAREIVELCKTEKSSAASYTGENNV